MGQFEFVDFCEGESGASDDLRRKIARDIANLFGGQLRCGRDGERYFEIKEDQCVGCNLCVSICPVPETITMRTLQPGEVDLRTGRAVSGEYANWTTHPNNPMSPAFLARAAAQTEAAGVA